MIIIEVYSMRNNIIYSIAPESYLVIHTLINNTDDKSYDSIVFAVIRVSLSGILIQCLWMIGLSHIENNRLFGV